MQDNPRQFDAGQPQASPPKTTEDLDSPLSRDFKENTLLLIIIVFPKQTQPKAI